MDSIYFTAKSVLTDAILFLRNSISIAVGAFEHGAVLAEQLNLRWRVYTTLSTLSAAYMMQGRFSIALDTVNRALALVEESSDHTEVARALNNRSAIWLSQGQVEQAHRDFQAFQADADGQATPPVQVGVCLGMAWWHCQK